MKYTNFKIRSQTKWLQFYYQRNIQLEENMFMLPCGFTYNVQSMCKNYKMPNAYDCETPVIYDLGCHNPTLRQV
jgi:hypothetical protein